jgi:hypothetical protein
VEVNGNGGVTFKKTWINPSPGIDSSALFAGSYFVNYSTNTGIVQIYGDYAVSGSTLNLDYANQLYASTATTPIVTTGSEAASGFIVSALNDTNVLSQLITITYNGSNWIVTGSSTTGTLCTIAGGSNADCGSPVQFHLAVPAGNANGDTANFGLIAASKDAGVQKQLFFGGAASGFNNGRSKLTIAPGSGLHAVGVSTATTLISMLSGGGTYYTFVDSGPFTVQYASFTNMDENGILLWGGAGNTYSINNSTFDYMCG